MTNRETDCQVEELGHTAEIGLRARGAPGAATPAALYACLAEAMFRLIRAEGTAIAGTAARTVRVAAPDAESLLVDWLNELLYLFETTGEFYTRCTVTAWTPTRLTATVQGGRPDRPPTLHIKAVTYHQLRVEETAAGWLAQVYFDI